MENAQPEKGTSYILHNSRLELNDPGFSKIVLQKIQQERNRKIKIQLWIRYSLIMVSLLLVLLFVILSSNIDLGQFSSLLSNEDSAQLQGLFGYFILPLLLLLGFKRLLDTRIRN